MKKIIVVKSTVKDEVANFLTDNNISYDDGEVMGDLERSYFIVSTRGYGKYEKEKKETFYDDVGNVYDNFDEYIKFVDSRTRNWTRSKTKNFADLEVYREKGHLSRSLEYILIRNNVSSEELLHMTDEEIKSLRGVGKKKFEELVNFIAWLAWNK